ncbi:hypothetical protein IP90_00963 [Luteimonas cucumeris]|uniref:Mor transcription activator family protein n=1 Tax=Luteimonas cucumeris TaxID=985012 RepID=A0A562LB98_9GAMM|nr:hypothetical protein [Luteimonas cucumeris]TWI04825.1 hypothetical protein IP90_00963 [Luteimonas cucumeris]
MEMTDKAMQELCERMRSQYGAGVEFELALRELIGRYRVAHEKRMRDVQAADLLHRGWREVSERFGVCKATVYNMAERGRESKQDQAA